MSPNDSAAKRVIAYAEAELALNAELDRMRAEAIEFDARLDEAAKITGRPPELEAEVAAVTPQKGSRPHVPEALAKKWAAQIERARRGRSE